MKKNLMIVILLMCIITSKSFSKDKYYLPPTAFVQDVRLIDDSILIYKNKKGYVYTSKIKDVINDTLVYNKSRMDSLIKENKELKKKINDGNIFVSIRYVMLTIGIMVVIVVFIFLISFSLKAFWNKF